MTEQKTKKPRTKKVKTEEPVIEEQPSIGDVPPSVTMDEVQDVVEPVVEENIFEPIVNDEDVFVPIPDTIKPMVGDIVSDLSTEQKIINFIESRDGGEIRMNDFLKSLYGVPKFGQPPLWMDKGELKRLRLLLDKLQNEGHFTFTSNAYLKLGQFYHAGDDQKTNHHNLNTLQIVAKK